MYLTVPYSFLSLVELNSTRQPFQGGKEIVHAGFLSNRSLFRECISRLSHKNKAHHAPFFVVLHIDMYIRM